MKTYTILSMLLVCLVIIGCSESTDGLGSDDDNGNEKNAEVDYSVLVANNGILSNTLLNANAKVITLNPSASPFGSITSPEYSYREGTELSFYKGNPDCSGEISKFDFSDNASNKTTVFEDLSNCELVVKSLAHSENAFYIAYEIPGSGVKETHYFIRTVDVSSSEATFLDVELEKKPIQLIFSNNRVFILSLDDDNDDKYALMVLDTITGELVHDFNLDFDAQKIFKTIDGNIMVSYPELHLVINSKTMAIISTVRYNDGKEPKFGYSDTGNFDAVGNLYYPMPTDLSGTSYPNIPGVYDFSSNTAILYFYENFLTEEEREFEFEIGDTSMVSYDTENNLILIGYQKSGNANLGGLLRIKPIPEPKFIDNIDLEGVPFEIFVK